jgi:hypothetical protein
MGKGGMGDGNKESMGKGIGEGKYSVKITTKHITHISVIQLAYRAVLNEQVE